MCELDEDIDCPICHTGKFIDGDMLETYCRNCGWSQEHGEGYYRFVCKNCGKPNNTIWAICDECKKRKVKRQ
jgi:predicted RNA-binding Zn-ribbon protein involved in translation (DUF1610 family)